MLATFDTKILSVCDGDTVKAWVCLNPMLNLWDLGHNQQGPRLRLANIQAAELHSTDPAVAARALRAKARVEALALGQVCSVTVVSLDEYRDRYDVLITIPGGHSLSQILLDEGLAVVWNGRGPRPVGRHGTGE